jgi:hypothetical protein
LFYATADKKDLSTDREGKLRARDGAGERGKKEEKAVITFAPLLSGCVRFATE